MITATVTAGPGQFALQGVGYAGRAGGAEMDVDGTTYPLSTSSGTVDVSAQGITGTFTVASSASAVGQGFVLSGLTFDVVAPLAASDVVVSFANSGTGFGEPTDPRTVPWVPSGRPGERSRWTSPSMAPEWFRSMPRPTARIPCSRTWLPNGTMPRWVRWRTPRCWGRRFTLVGSPSGGTGGLTITENDGGGIGIQGENPNRIDGLNYGPDNANSTPETLTWTLSAPPGLQLNLVELVACGRCRRRHRGLERHHRKRLSQPVGRGRHQRTERHLPHRRRFADLPGNPRRRLDHRRGDGRLHLLDRRGRSGDPGFDNGGGDNLWTTASNWNPDGLPVAPDDAIIDGYDVILDSAVASGPAALQILDGSLTIRGSGSLPVASMSIGEVLESEVRLVLEGSTASLSHTGSGVFTVGSSATVETIPDNGGSSPLELDNGELVLEIGYEWILDGSDYTGSFTLGDQFVLANFGTLTGPGFGSGNEDGFTDTAGFRTRNFDLPADRKLQLVATATSIYYEVVAQTAATGPNIIIINVDDMAGGQHFDFEGRDCLTPTLDSLASTGIRFTEGFAASTVCGPSRYALMTSRWASRNTSAQFIARYPLGTLGRFGVADTELETDNQNLGAWLQQAGYRTGMVGKGHFTDDDLNQTANWAAKGLLTYPQGADPKTDATTNAKMKHNHRVLCQRMRAFGFDYVSSYYKANLAELNNDALNVHNQEWITKGALDFIEENHDERFFLYMAPTINHGPVRNDLTKTLLADKGYTSAGYLPDEDYSFMPSRTGDRQRGAPVPGRN